MRFLLILVLCISCSVTLILSAPISLDPPLPKQDDEIKDIEAFVMSLDKKPNLLLSQTIKTDKKSFFGIILIPCKCCLWTENTFRAKNANLYPTQPPDIICFFAAKGFWPFYPPILQQQVNDMGKKVFSLSDDRLRQFCRGKFNFQETCYRPGESMQIQLRMLPDNTNECRFCLQFTTRVILCRFQMIQR